MQEVEAISLTAYNRGGKVYAEQDRKSTDEDLASEETSSRTAAGEDANPQKILQDRK